MNAILSAAREAQEFFAERKWRFCIIGGLAVLRWGAPRATQDVDMALLAGFGGEEPFIQAILARFSARIKDAAAFARECRVLLIQASNGIPIDLALAGILAYPQFLVQL